MVRARLRQIRMERARKRMMAAVPSAFRGGDHRPTWRLR